MNTKLLPALIGLGLSLVSPAKAQGSTAQGGMSVLRLFDATQKVGAAMCLVSTQYPHLSTDNKLQFVVDVINDVHGNKVWQTYASAKDPKIRQQMLSDYINTNCPEEYKNANW